MEMTLGYRLAVVAILLLLVAVNAKPAQDGRDIYEKQSQNQWFKDGLQFVRMNMKSREIIKKAKNVILFVGDGMGISTITAGRVLDGQLKGKSGEENVLSWEKFPFTAFSKTYNTDAQTPDSAGTASAMMTGVKTREAIVSMNEKVIRGNCGSSKGNEVLSILELAEIKGLATGVVTTARLTHATPSTTYAHSADRNWEYNAEMDCKDIASQLINFPYGDGIEVALGGGRRGFMPQSAPDPEYSTQRGRRKDNRDLTREWTQKSKPADKWEYVWNKAQFQRLNPGSVDHVLGLFEYSHMKYSTDTAQDSAGEPSLTEMTDFAIRTLKSKNRGFFLLVEGGRIDHGHHDNLGYRALHDTVEFAKAVEKANELTSEDDTLIIVTADHSHVFVFGGYQKRGHDIFGLAAASGRAKDSKYFTSLGYYNGPSAKANGQRDDPVGFTGKDYAQQSLVPLGSETHGAEDVGIFSRGPQAHLLRGVIEQSNIFHVMDYALCLSRDKEEMCRKQGLLSGSSHMMTNSFLIYFSSILLLFLSYISQI